MRILFYDVKRNREEKKAVELKKEIKKERKKLRKRGRGCWYWRGRKPINSSWLAGCYRLAPTFYFDGCFHKPNFLPQRSRKLSVVAGATPKPTINLSSQLSKYRAKVQTVIFPHSKCMTRKGKPLV